MAVGIACIRIRNGFVEEIGDEHEHGICPVQVGQHVPSYCYNCVSGPDLMNVKVVDGVATEIEPNFAAADVHPGKGRVCVKAYRLVQKTSTRIASAHR